MKNSEMVMGFIGVTASQSAINKVFPVWAEILGLGSVRLQPIDLPLNTKPGVFREVLREIKSDDSFRGALVTSHKVRILSACDDMFAGIDSFGLTLGEISCIANRPEGLFGYAKDPLTSGRSLEEFLPVGESGWSLPEVLCFGAGGSGMAIAAHLLTGSRESIRPSTFTLVNRSASRLDECAQIVEKLGVSERVQFVANEDPNFNDELMSALPAGALVINATGMGKDTPGSPITDKAIFPEEGFAWELNYRGELDFLRQAKRDSKRLRHVEDGWKYFIHGWSTVIAEVFNLSLNDELLRELEVASSGLKG